MGWEYLALLAITIIVGVVLAPKPTVPKPATLEDFDLPQVEEGTPQIVVFGDVWITGWMVINYGNLRSEGIEGESGKK